MSTFIAYLPPKYGSNIDEFQIHRNKSPQRIFRWPLPSETGNYYTRLSGFHEDDMLPWVLSSVHIQRVHHIQAARTDASILSWVETKILIFVFFAKISPKIHFRLERKSFFIQKLQIKRKFSWDFCENTKKLNIFLIKLESTLTSGLWKRNFFFRLYINSSHYDRPCKDGPGQDSQCWGFEERAPRTGLVGQGSW